ncbi:hypothetical protein B0H19DRAFT_1071701 [Mycena capillaripes]|nr:hypothetical protein B0H19DRAFT_1071701 [Mycena capillaripes]
MSHSPLSLFRLPVALFPPLQVVAVVLVDWAGEIGKEELISVERMILTGVDEVRWTGQREWNAFSALRLISPSPVLLRLIEAQVPKFNILELGMLSLGRLESADSNLIRRLTTRFRTALRGIDTYNSLSTRQAHVELSPTMLSKILAIGLYAFGIPHALTVESQLPMAGSQSAIQTGFYEIHNKAYDGQLAAFYRNELIVVLNNATMPKSPDLGKWKVMEVAPELYSISNVGLGRGLLPNDDNFLVAGKSDILFAITDAGNKSFTISNPEEEDQFWTLYSFCEAEVHLDPEMDMDEQRWTFKPWSQ